MAQRAESAGLLLSGFPKGTEVEPECEVTLEGGDDIENLYHDCNKNRGHKSFIPVPDFTMSHLPEEYQTPATVKKIKDLCDSTVKILVKYISKERPDTYADCNVPYPYSAKKGSKRLKRYGTGFVKSFDHDGTKTHVKGKPCPCQLCQKSETPEMEYWTLLVATATHVIFDDAEAACSIFECFFDTENRDEVKTMYGIDLMSRNLDFNKHQSDACVVNCVTHDRDLWSKMNELCSNYNFMFGMDTHELPIAYLISHPHGCSKRISFGNVHHITVPIDPNEYTTSTPIMFDEDTLCRLPLLPWSQESHGESEALLKDDRDGGDNCQSDNNVGPSDLSLSTNSIEKSDDMNHKEECKPFQTEGERLCNDITDTNESNPKELNPSTSIDNTSMLSKSDDELRCTRSDSQPTNCDEDPDPKASRKASSVSEKSTSTSLESGEESYENSDSVNFNFMEALAALLSMSVDYSEPTYSVIDEITKLDKGILPAGAKIAFSPDLGDIISLPSGMSLTLPPEVKIAMRTRNVLSDFCPIPGTEFSIPLGTTFILPPKADYAKQFEYLNPAWFTFPKGTTFKLPNGKPIFLPPETKFKSRRLSLRFAYVTYDMASCPGSSGAIIHQEGIAYNTSMGLPFSVYKFSHYGAIQEGKNRSGLQNLYLKFE